MIILILLSVFPLSRFPWTIDSISNTDNRCSVHSQCRCAVHSNVIYQCFMRSTKICKSRPTSPILTIKYAFNKDLRCRKGTARRDISVEILSNATEKHENNAFLQIGE